MNIAIVDDEEIYLTFLHDALVDELNNIGITDTNIDLFHSTEEILASWTPHKYHLLFLDIYMGEENGIRLAQRIREQDTEAIIIFCTTSNEFAAQSYEVDASYYLLKPPTKETLSSMLQRLQLSRLQKRQHIVLPDGFRCILYSIKYTEYNNHSVIFHLQENETHSVYMAHSQAEALLHPHSDFHTINKGCIVNFRMVDQITKNSFIMKDKTELPISRGRFKEVSQAYAKFRLLAISHKLS